MKKSTANFLTVKNIGEVFTNNFGYNSRKVKFYDPKNGFEKEIYLHERHSGYTSIWDLIQENGIKAQPLGSIKKLDINESLIMSVKAYEKAKIISFMATGIFVVFVYSDLNEKGQLQMALKNQIYEFVKAENVLFDPYELNDDEYLNKD